MTKKQEAELMELFKKEIKDATYRGVTAGFKSAYQAMVEQIDSGWTLEQLRQWAFRENKQTEIIEKVTLDNN